MIRLWPDGMEWSSNVNWILVQYSVTEFLRYHLTQNILYNITATVLKTNDGLFVKYFVGISFWLLCVSHLFCSCYLKVFILFCTHLGSGSCYLNF